MNDTTATANACAALLAYYRAHGNHERAVWWRDRLDNLLNCPNSVAAGVELDTYELTQAERRALLQ